MTHDRRPAILVIDPEIGERSRLVSILRGLGCEVRWSTDLHRVPRDHPDASFDIVVVDVDALDEAAMFGAMEKCDLLRSTPGLRIVALTRFPDPSRDEILALAGCEGGTPLSRMDAAIRSAIETVRQSPMAWA